MKQWETKDSGKRREFETGSVRDTREGKGRYDLLPAPAIRRVAGVYERGATKYGDRNWEKGQPLMGYIDSGMRHLFQYVDGKVDEDHLAQAAWNILAALATEEWIQDGRLPEKLNDHPYRQDRDYPHGVVPYRDDEGVAAAIEAIRVGPENDTTSTDLFNLHLRHPLSPLGNSVTRTCMCGDPGDCNNCQEC